jgi:iron complex outermembrane receptor protein
MRMRKRAVGSRLTATSLMVMTGVGLVHAQTAPLELTEIVVTAQKRVEVLQDVPLSLAVVPAEQLRAFSFNETTDIQYLVPGVTLTNSAGPRNFGFFIRGIGTSSFASESIEGSVGYVLDGVVLGQAGASLVDLPDVERLEVLRGPQATLFGKNASAGIINVVTRVPTDTFTAHGSVSWAGPDDERKVSAYASGPISDTVRYSLSGRLNKRDGYIDNVSDGRKLNDRDDYGFRGKLALTPSDRLGIVLTADWWKRDAQCCIWTLRSTGGPPPSGPEQLSLLAGVVPGEDNLRQNIDGDVFSSTRSYGASMQVDYDLGAGYALTSTSAWRRWTDSDGLDSDSSPLNLLDVNSADFAQRQWTQELRLTSPVGGFVDYVAGLFYFDGDVTSVSTQRFPTVPLPFVNKVVRNEAGTRNAALFGQANLHLTDQFRFILGARALDEKTRASKARRDPLLQLTAPPVSASKSDSPILWRTGLQYDFTPDVMAFATATRGYKGGGYDTNIGIPTLPDVRPEKPTNYEVGLRTSWPQQRLVLNLTAFDTHVKDYQVAARDAALGPSVYRIGNGEAKSRGVELELTSRPFSAVDFTVLASAAYTDARWGSYPGASCYTGQTAAQGCVNGVQDLSDERVPYSPDWSGNLSSHFKTQAFNPSTALFFDLGVSYRSKMGIAFPNDPNTIADGLTLVNASIGFAAEDERWKLALFGKNLTDEHYAAAIFPTPLGAAPRNYSQFIPYEAQRIVGVSLDVSF